MNNKQLLLNILFTDLVNKYASGNSVSETEFRIMIETLKSNHDDRIDDSNLKSYEKAYLKNLYKKLADSVQDYALESLRIENKLLK